MFLKRLSDKRRTIKMNKLKSLLSKWNQFDVTTNSFTKAMKKLIIKEFLSEAKSMQKCPHCTELKPHIKKDGNTKFSISFRKGQEN